MWPLSRFPEILPRGEAFVRKWGVPSIFIGRFFGPLRASVPLAAGIFEMSYWQFQLANFVSALIWSAALLVFGDVIGKLAEWLWRGGGEGAVLFLRVFPTGRQSPRKRFGVSLPTRRL